MAVHRLDRAEARRIAIRAQLLDAHRPPGLLEVVQQLMFLQLDPTAAIAPSADLVAWTRLGGAYDPAQLAARSQSPDVRVGSASGTSRNAYTRTTSPPRRSRPPWRSATADA